MSEEMCNIHLNKMTAMILDFIVYLSQQKDIEKIVDELKRLTVLFSIRLL